MDGQTGFLCPPGDEGALADALEKLLRSPELRREFGAAGQQRVQTEFGVDETVKVLRALYQTHVPTAPPTPARAAGLAVLLDEWPAGERVDTELRQLSEAMPNFRVYVFRGSQTPPSEGWQRTLAHCEFLPDAMVLEGDWQQECDLRHRLESWRGELGGKVSTEEFLRQARYALAVAKVLTRDGIRHVHAASARELMAAWLLHRLSGVTFSVSLEDGSPLHDDPVLEMARASAGLRLPPGRLARKISALKPVSPAMTERKGGRGLDATWLNQLRGWVAQAKGANL